MNNIPIGSIWTHEPTGTHRIVLACVEAYNPPTGMKMIRYHIVQENRTLVVLSHVGEWMHTYELLTE